MSRPVVAALAVLAVCGLFTPAVAAGAVGTDTATTTLAPTTDPGSNESRADGTSGPRIVGVVPNPVAENDRGEFVVLAVPNGTRLGSVTLSDGEATLSLPNRTTGGRIAVTTDPAAVRPLTDHPVVTARPRSDGSFRLSNAGERVTLGHRDETVDTLTYGEAPEGEVRRAEGWRPLGATDRPPVTTGPANTTAFVLPDSPGIPRQTLRSADDRILLAGYTLTSRRIEGVLKDAADRGVRVAVLVDGDPVGGFPARQARLLSNLTDSNVSVRVLGGPAARYRFHHPKYAVVDGRALVLTENWKPAGVGGRSSRGWGVVVDDPEFARELAGYFRADRGWRDAVPWAEYRERVETVPTSPSVGGYDRRISPASVTARSVTLLAAPDNAEASLVDLLRGANDSIRILLVSLGDRANPLTRATLAAARRGVEVRILVSGAWYVREENRRRVEWLRRVAREEDLDLSAKLVEPNGRFEKVHAKGVVVDDQVVLGSLNWNRNSLRENREVVVVLRGEAVAGYYREAFDADWSGGGTRFRVLLAATLLAVALVAVAVGWRRIEFGDPSGVEPDDAPGVRPAGEQGDDTECEEYVRG